jgi:hypothetical protein
MWQSLTVPFKEANMSNLRTFHDYAFVAKRNDKYMNTALSHGARQLHALFSAAGLRGRRVLTSLKVRVVRIREAITNSVTLDHEYDECAPDESVEFDSSPTYPPRRLFRSLGMSFHGVTSLWTIS